MFRYTLDRVGCTLLEAFDAFMTIIALALVWYLLFT